MGASLNNGAKAFFQKGVLDEARIYNQPLSAGDVQALFSNTAPSVSITSPANGATFTAPASITITANASDSDGTVTQVEFFNGATSLGVDTSAPYSVTWNNVTAGNYSLTARATDDLSASTTSGAVSITVNSAGNNPPSVSISSPANGATFTAPANITITASASDSDGSVTQVEFFNGTTSLGVDTSAPYSVPWNNVTNGSYSLTARATDNSGATTTSTAVNITVNPAATPVPRDGLASVSYDQTTNRINTAGWEYDAAGNQTRVQRADGSWQRHVYDAAGRLVKVQNDSSVTQIIHTYGASNHRLIEQVGNESSNQRTYYAWAGNSVLAEYEETAAAPTTPRWVKSYVYLGGRLLATIAPTGGSERVEYQHPDRLGTRLVTNNLDATSFEHVSLPFGTALDAESTGSTKRRFTSYDRSTVTGLDYAVNRHYDPLQGRFTQVDPIGMASTSLSNPQTLNLYAYCANDPINHSDPSGLGFFSFLGKIFGAIGKAFKVLTKVFAVVGAVAAVVFLALGMPYVALAFAIMSGSLFATAYGPPIVGKVLLAVGAAARGVTVAGTPPIVGGRGGTGVGAINSFLQGSGPIIPGGTFRWIVLTQAINAAIAAINRRSSCRELFVGYINPVDVLREIQGGRGRGTFRFGTRDPFGRAIGADTSAVTTPKFEYRLIAAWRLANVGVRGADITINTGGPFFTGYRGRFAASNAVNRAVTVIHELGHAVDYIYRSEYTSRIIDDMDNAQESAANSQLVYNECFR